MSYGSTFECFAKDALFIGKARLDLWFQRNRLEVFTTYDISGYLDSGSRNFLSPKLYHMCLFTTNDAVYNLNELNPSPAEPGYDLPLQTV